MYITCATIRSATARWVQGISDTTGVPAIIGAAMVMTGKWKKPGVLTLEEFDPDPFMDALNQFGLPVAGELCAGTDRLEERLAVLDFNTVPTPCYVVDEGLLENNLKLLHSVEERTGCRILLALKGFAMYSLFGLVGRYS